MKMLTKYLNYTHISYAKQTSFINASKIREVCENIETEEHRLNQAGFWKIKKKLCPSQSDPPTAKTDSCGNLITSPESLKKLYLEIYKLRLAHRDMIPELTDIYDLKMKLWASLMQELRKLKSPPWTLAVLNNTLACLKNNKA